MYGDDDAFTKAGYDVFKQALDSNGVQILATETFKKGDTDYSAQLTKIKGLNPDAIVVSALAEEAAGIMSQARQLGIPDSVRFIGGNGFNSPQLAKLAGTAAEGAISGAAWFIGAETPGNQAFVRAYQEKYDAQPDQFAAQAYVGMKLIDQAVRSGCSGERDAIKEGLGGIDAVPTVLGELSINENRDAEHPAVVQVVENGSFAVLD